MHVRYRPTTLRAAEETMRRTTLELQDLRKRSSLQSKGRSRDNNGTVEKADLRTLAGIGSLCTDVGGTSVHRLGIGEFH